MRPWVPHTEGLSRSFPNKAYLIAQSSLLLANVVTIPLIIVCNWWLTSNLSAKQLMNPCIQHMEYWFSTYTYMSCVAKLLVISIAGIRIYSFWIEDELHRSISEQRTKLNMYLNAFHFYAGCTLPLLYGFRVFWEFCGGFMILDAASCDTFQLYSMNYHKIVLERDFTPDEQTYRKQIIVIWTCLVILRICTTVSIFVLVRLFRSVRIQPPQYLRQRFWERTSASRTPVLMSSIHSYRLNAGAQIPQPVSHRPRGLHSSELHSLAEFKYGDLLKHSRPKSERSDRGPEDEQKSNSAGANLQLKQHGAPDVECRVENSDGRSACDLAQARTDQEMCETTPGQVQADMAALHPYTGACDIDHESTSNLSRPLGHTGQSNRETPRSVSYSEHSEPASADNHDIEGTLGLDESHVWEISTLVSNPNDSDLPSMSASAGLNSQARPMELPSDTRREILRFARRESLVRAQSNAREHVSLRLYQGRRSRLEDARPYDYLNSHKQLYCFLLFQLALVIYLTDLASIPECCATDMFAFRDLHQKLNCGVFRIVRFWTGCRFALKHCVDGVCLCVREKIGVKCCQRKYQEHLDRRVRRRDFVRKNEAHMSMLIKELAQNIDTVCCICYNEYSKHDTLILLPCRFKHYCHKMCILAWLRRNDTCPLCRHSIAYEIHAAVSSPPIP